MYSRGIALLSVLVVLTLVSLAVLAGARLGLLKEMIVGRQADQLRVQADAEALLLDAEADILGTHDDGRPCRPVAEGSPRSAPGFVGCRERGTGAQPAAPYFPQSLDEFDEVRALLQVGTALPCRDGICAPSSLTALAALEDAPQTFRELGARHGQYTGTHASSTITPGVRNAWYWIEMFRYQTDAGVLTALHHAHPDPNRPFIYRITVVAEGLRPGTRAVVKSLFVPYPTAQLP